MTTYRGPHASVKQEFEVSPAAIAIESLPPVAVATAYDVYAKEMLGLASGIADLVSVWPTSEKVVHSRDVAGFRAFEFYPPRVYANTSFGYRELFGAESGDTDIELSAAGVEVAKDAAYTLPNTEKSAGSCTAIIPFYNQTTAGGGVTIAADDLRTVVVAGGAVATAQLKAGQKVLILVGASWTDVGVVGTIGADETKIKLASAYSEAVTGTQIIVGSINTTDERDRPNTLYDANADFVAARVRPGDLVKFSSLAIPDSLSNEIVASIVSVVDKNTIKFNTVAPTTNLEPYEGYKASTAAPGNTVSVYEYKIERLCGFSQNYNLAAIGDPDEGVKLDNVSSSKTQFEFADTIGGDTVPTLTAGDIIMVTDANTLPSTHLRPYTIKSIVHSVDKYIVTVDVAMNQSAVSPDTPIADDDFLHAWHPRVQHDIVSDFRAIRSAEHMVTKRIASVKDITDAWSRNGEISLYNELAYMALIEFNLAGGRVCYGVNVDSSADNLSAEYTEALELMKVLDVYSHALGTTDGGVNALMGAYCDQQADPYEGHERKAILAYDQRDVFLLGADSGNVSSAGLVTIDGAINLMTIGLTVKDKVEVYGDDGELLETMNVTSTPTVSNQVQTDGDTAYTGNSMRFVCNRPNAQALLIGALGSGNRRLKIVWPGWFSAQFNGEAVNVPPYYMTAAGAGNDCAIIASQSFTNMDYAIPGLSSYSLNTNFYFKKSDLDEIGGGGVDVMIQDAQVSQTIKSRHDLTTNMDAVEYRENSITKQADVAAKTLRSAVAPYVGRYNIGPALFKFLGQVCSIVCTKLVKDSILAKIEVVSITRDPVIADKINFVINATVFVAGNYYDITLYVKSR